MSLQGPSNRVAAGFMVGEVIELADVAKILKG